ncbi:MAG: glycosyltransferase family 4 protein [Planctomycetota bacterium]|nr:glycosyltransferase family 4 protein [Planctomycetota bacterium]
MLCSEEDARTLRERYGALECAAVPSGFDPEHFRPSEPPPERDAKRLLFLGSMDYGPNVDAAVHFARELLPGLRARRPDVVLEIVGPDATQEVRALDGDGTEVVGRVPDVRPYLERAAMLVVPLRIGGGTRLKIVEALAMGTPVASTAIGAEGLGLEHGRHLVTAPSPGALVPEIERLLDDPAEARELGRGGREHVHARYPWSALAGDLFDFWRRVAASCSLPLVGSD